MSETDSKATPAAVETTGPENQHQRWMKYGANVVFVSIVVVLLAIFVTALAQFSWAKARMDTTQAGVYSLKPQTKQILKDLRQNVRIVSLYTNVKPPADAAKAKDFVDYSTPVADLLEEYKRYGGGKVEVEVIDPTQNPAKVDDLIANVTERYGGEVKAYRDFLDGYTGAGKTEEQLKKILTDEVKAASALSEADLQAQSKLSEVAQAALDTSKSLLRRIDETVRARKRQLEEKPPNYKRAVDGISTNAEDVSDAAGQLVKLLDQFKDEATAPAAVKKYAAEATPRFQDLQKRAIAVTDAVKKLGALKLDDLRTQLKARDGIVVLGPKDMRTLSFEEVWQTDPNVRRELMNPDAKIKPRFAGEQRITSAILSLTQEKKPKVAFVRPGGQPLTTNGGFFGPNGPLSQIAARLKEYNFDVVEKDLTGTWAMQSQMQQRGMPPEPEPSDEEIKDAIWVVLSFPSGPGPMGAPASIAGKVKEHLDKGGSALCLFIPQGDNLDGALGEWGIKVRTDAVAVHEPVPSTGAQSTDIVQLAQRQPSIFVLNSFGDHMLAKPVNSLDTVMVQLCPVSTTTKQGYTASSLIPIPADPKSWGETNAESASNPAELSFDSKTDLAGPLFGGAAVEKEKGGRVVAIGSIQFAINDLLSYPDRELLERGYYTPRFPGSAELFLNSVFWLAHMEPMIAISPSAMDVSRIEPMSNGAQVFWRTGVLLVGLPLLVIAAGGLMYIRRRD